MSEPRRYVYMFVCANDVDGVHYPSATLDRSNVMTLARQYAQVCAQPDSFERLLILLEKSDEELSAGESFPFDDEGSLYFLVIPLDEPARILWSRA